MFKNTENRLTTFQIGPNRFLFWRSSEKCFWKFWELFSKKFPNKPLTLFFWSLYFSWICEMVVVVVMALTAQIRAVVVAMVVVGFLWGGWLQWWWYWGSDYGNNHVGRAGRVPWFVVVVWWWYWWDFMRILGWNPSFKHFACFVSYVLWLHFLESASSGWKKILVQCYLNFHICIQMQRILLHSGMIIYLCRLLLHCVKTCLCFGCSSGF